MSDEKPNIIGPDNFETQEDWEAFQKMDGEMAGIFAEASRKCEAALTRLKALGIDPQSSDPELFGAMSDEQLDSELSFHELYEDPQHDEHDELYAPWETELTRRKWAAEDEKARRAKS